MQLRPSMSLPLAGVLSALSVLVLTGCSDLPTQVSDASFSDAPNAPQQVIDVDPGTGDEQGGSQYSTVAEEIEASIGGVVQNGSWRVTIPRLALKGDAKVTLTVSDPSRNVCELSVEPAAYNDFRKAVLLQNFRPTNKALHKARMYTRNSAGGWEEIFSKANPKTMAREANIYHFSSYGCGPTAP